VLRAVVQIPELDWRVIVEQPRQAVMAPVWATLQRTALFGALGIATALVSALVLANRLTLPLRQLHHAVGQVASGQLDTVIAVQGRGELAELATQFNHMAQGLRSSYAELEDRIAAKTMDLQRANRHKSEFLANMSHELRTPLNAILGFADILSAEMAGPLSDEQREYVADIHASGLHLLALINDVLDVSRIEAGQLALERTEFDVAEVVEAAATLVRQRALHKGVALHIETAPEVSTWVADARRFKQVVLNLLNNAVKFTPEGGHIHVRTGANAAEGLWVEVQDSGIGIAPADHAAVFEEFRQVGDAAGRAEGSGLGLALAQRLVAQHGGRVTLTSALGAGASFRFNIPRHDVGDPP
jgi:signal transduction histidine kinase